jgi:DNA-binding transcriptional MerR regulator
MGEVCKIFGRSDKTIERWHKEGILCYSTVMDEGNRMFSVEEVEALKEDLKRKREQRYNGSA